jgi:uncharacterized membrane protein
VTTTLQLLLLGHVLGTTVLVGGAFMLQILAVLASRSAAPGDLVTLARQAAWIGPRIFLPAAALVVVTGAGLVAQLGYSFDEPFAVIGLGAILVAAVTGPAYLAPESARISGLMTAGGAAADEARARVRRLFLVSRIELVLLVLAVGAMVVKPSF